MYYGVDSDGNKVHIDDSVKDDSYVCPACGGLLVRKCGSIKVHHFAHKQALCDPWYKDNKGEWHRNMQSHFKSEQCEFRITDSDGVFHIADVFIENVDRPNTIIEFQHSPISIEEFDARNEFYINNGTNEKFDKNEIIWVFDYRAKQIFVDVSAKPFYKWNGFSYNFIPINEHDFIKDYVKKMVDGINQCHGRLYDTTCEDMFDYNKYMYVSPDYNPCSGKYAQIYINHPSMLFKNIRENMSIHVYFDVNQRIYVINSSMDKRFYLNDFYSIERKYASEKVDDFIDSYFVYVSNEYPEKNSFASILHKYFMNSGLSDGYKLIWGRCLMHDDFFKFYA